METVNKEELKQRRIKHAQILGKNKMRAEAVRQMKIAGFKNEIIQEFESNNIFYVSNIGNDLSKADEVENKLVKILEEKHKDIIIYHIEKRKTDNRLFYHYFHINSKYQNRVITEIRYLWEEKD